MLELSALELFEEGETIAQGTLEAKPANCLVMYPISGETKLPVNLVDTGEVQELKANRFVARDEGPVDRQSAASGRIR